MSQCNSVQHRSHTDCPGIEHRPPRSEAGVANTTPRTFINRGAPKAATLPPPNRNKKEILQTLNNTFYVIHPSVEINQGNRMVTSTLEVHQKYIRTLMIPQAVLPEDGDQYIRSLMMIPQAVLPEDGALAPKHITALCITLMCEYQSAFGWCNEFTIVKSI